MQRTDRGFREATWDEALDYTVNAIRLLMALILLMVSVPGAYMPGLNAFAFLMFALGCAMGIGNASVFKYIPDYFPDDVGAAGGEVGALGALGGFILPPAFGWLGRSRSCDSELHLCLHAHTEGSMSAACSRSAEACHIKSGNDLLRTRLAVSITPRMVLKAVFTLGGSFAVRNLETDVVRSPVNRESKALYSSRYSVKRTLHDSYSL